MATMDMIKLYGGEPANFLDIGGSSNPQKVIDAMNQIGLALPTTLKETSEAGLAKTPTAKAIEERLYGKKE